MSRVRYVRDDLAASDCTPGTDANYQMPATPTTNSTISISVQPQEMFNDGPRWAFTTPQNDPGTEDLPAASVFTFNANVNTAGSPISYRFVLHMLDATGCTLQGSAQMQAEAPFTGNGVKVATFTFDPPSAGRWQIRVETQGNGMHGDPNQTLDIDSRSTNTRLIAPDAPAGAPRRVMSIS